MSPPPPPARYDDNGTERPRRAGEVGRIPANWGRARLGGAAVTGCWQRGLGTERPRPECAGRRGASDLLRASRPSGLDPETWAPLRARGSVFRCLLPPEVRAAPRGSNH